MKLGFQGWFLLQPHTGIGQHSLGLLKALFAQGTELTVVVPSAVKISGIPAPSVHVLRPKRYLLHPALKKWFWERIQVPAFFAHQNLDWEYYPYPSPLPPHSPHRRAMTVHDLILWKDPRSKGGRLKRLYHGQTRSTLPYMDHIFTVSEATHRELKMPRATVLPNAVTVPSSLTKKPYQNDLIYIGGYDVRKQVPQLIQAFADYHTSHPERRLLLVGRPHHNSAHYPKLPPHKAVIFLDKLSEKELYSALKSAFAFVHFSDSEGFNLPLLQALSVGTPAVVRDLPVNREVSQGAALFWNPSRPGDFSAKLETLKNPQRRAALIAAGKKVARLYSWSRTSKIFLAALHS